MRDPKRDEIYLLAEHLLSSGVDGLPDRERRVIERCAKRLAVTRPVHREFEHGLTFGERLADKVAEFGGSWTFISCFGAFLLLWTGTISGCSAIPSTPIRSSSSI